MLHWLFHRLLCRCDRWLYPDMAAFPEMREYTFKLRCPVCGYAKEVKGHEIQDALEGAP